MTTLSDSDQRFTLSWTGIVCSGADAYGFLQGQVTGDIVGKQAMGLILTPASDVISNYWATFDGHRVTLNVRSELVDVVLARLRRFKLRSQLEIEATEPTLQPYATATEQVAVGIPGPLEFAGGFSPHSFGAAFVRDNVSFTKGCFTGQELVGRLDARGANVPYRLAIVEAPDLSIAESEIAKFGPSGEAALQRVCTTASLTPLKAMAMVHRSMLDAESAIRVEAVQ